MNEITEESLRAPHGYHLVGPERETYQVKIVVQVYFKEFLHFHLKKKSQATLLATVVPPFKNISS